MTAEQIRERITELGAQITADYADRAPLLVGILKGAFMFMADLAREIDLPVEFDFMAVASYGNATKSSGVVRIVKDLDIDLQGRDVLLVEDIVDSGLTLRYLKRNLESRNPASLEVCALLLREGAADGASLKYVGFEIPPDFENRVMNVHPALIPAFCGHGMYGHHVHEAVIGYGVKVSGATVHFANNEYDAGPIILQDTVPVLDDDTPESLAARVQAKERELYPKAIRLFAEGRLHVEGRRVRIREPR